MLLHVIANPRGDDESRSKRIARAFLDGFNEANPDAEIREIDLYDVDLPMTDAKDANTRLHQARGDLNPAEQKRLDRFCTFIDPLLACDRLLITTPMWNFGPTWKLKQWIDTVVQARITFEYTPSGPKGLLNAKGALVGSRGGAYPDDKDPRESGDFLVPYLTHIMKWIGITDIRTCFADAVDAKKDQAEAYLRECEANARELGKAF